MSVNESMDVCTDMHIDTYKTFVQLCIELCAQAPEIESNRANTVLREPEVWPVLIWLGTFNGIDVGV